MYAERLEALRLAIGSRREKDGVDVVLQTAEAYFQWLTGSDKTAQAVNRAILMAGQRAVDPPPFGAVRPYESGQP